MAGLNKVMLIGRLGADPEVKYSPSGMAITTFRIATSERWKGKDGNLQERTEWHRIVTFGKTAEICAEYLGKGKQIYIEGRLQTRSWEDKDGNKRYTTEVIANTIQMLGSPSDDAKGQTIEEAGLPENNTTPIDDVPF